MSAQACEKKCPICDRPADAQFYPFCSRRCANVDLGNWFAGDYTIPTEEGPSDEEDD